MRKLLISFMFLMCGLQAAQNVTLIPNGSGTGTLNTPGITYYNYVAGITVDFTGVRLIGISGGGGGGGGNVTGPGTSVVGDIPTYGNTAGTSIVDGGVWSINPSGNILTGTYATFNATTSSLLLTTSTTATAGNPKWSPAIFWSGNYYSAGAKTALWKSELQTSYSANGVSGNALVFSGNDNGGSFAQGLVILESNGGAIWSPTVYTPFVQNEVGNLVLLAGASAGITITETTALLQFNAYTTAGILQNDTSGNVTTAGWKFVSSGNVLQTPGGAQFQDVSGTGAVAIVANNSNSGVTLQAQAGGTILSKIAGTSVFRVNATGAAVGVDPFFNFCVQNTVQSSISSIGQDSTHLLFLEWNYSATPSSGFATIGTFGQSGGITFSASGYTFNTTSVSPALVIGSNGDVTAGNGADTGAPLGVNGNFIATGTVATGGGAGWKITAVNTVSPTSPNRTFTLTYNGTAYYVAAKTTDD